MTHPMNLRSVAQQLYVRALSTAWRNRVQLYDPSQWLIREPELEEKALRDADIAHAVGYRRHLIAGKNWQVTATNPNSKRGQMAAHVAEGLIRNIKHFTQARMNLARAFFSGARFGEIVLERRTLTIGDGKPRTWAVPVAIKDMDKMRFRIVPTEKDGVIRAHWQVFDLAKGDWCDQTMDGYRRTIRHVYADDEATLGHGRGLREALGWWWYAKEHVFHESLGAVEKFARGILSAKVRGVRDAETGLPNSTLIAEWQAVLEDMNARNVLVYDSEDTVEMVRMDGTGWQLMSTIRGELRSAIFTLILGANLTTSAESGGSYALAEIQENSTEALIQFDRESLEETLSDDLIGCLWHFNAGNIADLGLDAEPAPRFKITQEKKNDPKQRVDVASMLHNMGVDLPLRDLYEQTGFRMPEPGEPKVDGNKPPPPGAGGPPGGAPGGQPGGGPPMPFVRTPDEFEAFEDPRGTAEKFERQQFSGNFNEALHPRDDHGRFVNADEIAQAQKDPAKAEELRSRVNDPAQREKLDDVLKRTEPSEKYGMTYTEGNEKIVEKARALGDDLWNRLPVQTLKHGTEVHANESHLKPGPINKVISGQMGFKEGYVIKLWNDNGNLHVVDGHHRVAMYHALGKDMPVRIMDQSEYDALTKGQMSARSMLDMVNAGLLFAAGWDESKHPRDDHGRFVPKDQIEAAKNDPEKADALRARVTDPEERKKLEHHLGGDGAGSGKPADGGEAKQPAKPPTNTAEQAPEYLSEESLHAIAESIDGGAEPSKDPALNGALVPKDADAMLAWCRDFYNKIAGDMSLGIKETKPPNNTAGSIEELMAHAKEVAPAYAKIVREAAGETGGEAAFGPNDSALLKKEAKIRGNIPKKMAEKAKSFEQVLGEFSDAVRGSLIFPTIQTMKEGILSVKAKIEAAGGSISIDNKYEGKLKPSGYSAVHAQINMPTKDGGTVQAELQFHLPWMFDGKGGGAKEFTHDLMDLGKDKEHEAEANKAMCLMFVAAAERWARTQPRYADLSLAGKYASKSKYATKGSTKMSREKKPMATVDYWYDPGTGIWEEHDGGKKWILVVPDGSRYLWDTGDARVTVYSDDLVRSATYEKAKWWLEEMRKAGDKGGNTTGKYPRVNGSGLTPPPGEADGR